jgi:large subunit ribosomal protein L30
MSSLRITYRKSSIGYARDQKETLYALGLRKLNQSVLQPDNPSVRGMIFKVQHLVSVEEVQDEVQA